MATDDPDLIGPDDVAFTLDLTPRELKIVHSALRSLRDDFGHDQHDVHKIIHYDETLTIDGPVTREWHVDDPGPEPRQPPGREPRHRRVRG